MNVDKKVGGIERWRYKKTSENMPEILARSILPILKGDSDDRHVESLQPAILPEPHTR
jgi:hypothetical protein